MANNENSSPQHPVLGSALAISAGFAFYVLCMVLPLVGPAGSRVPHAAKNQATFLSILCITLILAGASTYVAMRNRRQTGGRLPFFSIGVGVVCLLFFVLTLFNGFAI